MFLTKYILQLVFCVTCVAAHFCADAQYAKHIIQLTNKANNAFNLKDPAAYLSPRALQRRAKSNTAIDSSDLPVSKLYVDSIAKTPEVKVLSTSKWLNLVLIETTNAQAIDAINKLSFVKATRAVGNKNTQRTIYKHIIDSTKQYLLPEGKQFGSTDQYAYGNNYQQVHLHNGEYLHNKGYHGENMQIAVLDAGFGSFKTITAFDSIRNNKQVLGEKDFVAFDNSVNEDDNHGMQCLSTIAANWPGQMVGTAPKANFWLVRTENSATEFPVEEFNWVAGAEFADSAGADLISSSLGYARFDDPAFDHTYNELYKTSTTVSKGAALAARKGLIVLNSAGNEGNNDWRYIVFPADADSICTVGAVTPSAVIANFSSVGYPGKIKPNIVSVGAPAIVAGLANKPVSGYGTSFSTPNVAGLITCLWQAFPMANNMKILDAVYKSADRYTTPDDHYGYGLPDFKTAYLLLKHEQNIAQYGSNFLSASPNPFLNQVSIVLIGQSDGSARVDLVDDQGKILSSKSLETEKEEVYRFSFSNLFNVPAGNYTLKYSDNASTHSIALQKGNLLDKDWFTPLPNPFQNEFTVYLKAPETGEVRLRLLDTRGSTVETITTEVMQGQPSFIHFNNLQSAQPGTYFLQYLGKTHKRTIRVLKN